MLKPHAKCSKSDSPSLYFGACSQNLEISKLQMTEFEGYTSCYGVLTALYDVSGHLRRYLAGNLAFQFLTPI